MFIVSGLSRFVFALNEWHVGQIMAADFFVVPTATVSCSSW